MTRKQKTLITKRLKAEIEAEARLVNAAPDMLAACQMFVGSWMEDRHAYALSELAQAREQARDAIAKATGAKAAKGWLPDVLERASREEAKQ